MNLRWPKNCKAFIHTSPPGKHKKVETVLTKMANHWINCKNPLPSKLFGIGLNIPTRSNGFSWIGYSAKNLAASEDDPGILSWIIWLKNLMGSGGGGKFDSSEPAVSLSCGIGGFSHSPNAGISFRSITKMVWFRIVLLFVDKLSGSIAISKLLS